MLWMVFHYGSLELSTKVRMKARSSKKNTCRAMVSFALTSSARVHDSVLARIAWCLLGLLFCANTFTFLFNGEDTLSEIRLNDCVCNYGFLTNMILN